MKVLLSKERLKLLDLNYLGIFGITFHSDIELRQFKRPWKAISKRDKIIFQKEVQIWLFPMSN